MHLLGLMLMSDLEHIMQANAKKAKTPPPAPQVISHEVQTPPGWQRSDKLDPSLYGEHALKGAGHQLEPPFCPAGTAKPAATAGEARFRHSSSSGHLWCTCPSGDGDGWATAVPAWPLQAGGIAFHAGTMEDPAWHGDMAKQYPFTLDPFQSTAVACLVRCTLFAHVQPCDCVE